MILDKIDKYMNEDVHRVKRIQILQSDGLNDELYGKINEIIEMVNFVSSHVKILGER